MTTAKQLDAGADALRKFEMAGRILRQWEDISAAQKRSWREKANAVLEAAEQAA